MGIFYETLEQFMQKGGLKQTTITANQLLPAIVAHMVRLDRKFTLYVNGRLPKPMNKMLEEVFELCHLQQPFYTQHCASRKSSYISVSKNRVKIDFTFTYRMSREDEKWVVNEMKEILQTIITYKMTDIEKVIIVHDYIVRNFKYELNTTGSPFTVQTFMKEGQGVCMAYALLFEKMMAMMNIKCLYVVGKAVGESNLGHAWNMVELDGQWYHIDTTWNNLGSRSSMYEIRYRYLLKSDEFMKRDHMWEITHYPACTSTYFDVLEDIYDAAYFKGDIYYPGNQRFLSKLNLNTLKSERVLFLKIQYCILNGDKLLFSNRNDHGYLYEYSLISKSLIKLGDKAVLKIIKTLKNIIVYYENNYEVIAEFRKCISENTNQINLEKANVTVPLIPLGNDWLGTYEGNANSIEFGNDKDIKITILQHFKQLTVSITKLNNVLAISFTSKRKPIQIEEGLSKLWIPVDFSNQVNGVFVNEQGEEIPYTKVEDYFVVPIKKSGKIIMR